ncbi:zinc-dependent peptidase [Shewanella sp. VB17]|uniref:M90 family metallopeptidase n=1 Tax=Shewanella sp. VB17 TaxID=2739432 RepID=UPI0015673BD6|nr:M90 family metallopeptidase [Shewanella sp. VB17]NRD73284.1 zinc-dependent peptidase [Shewanella sp. VB17]
MLAIIIVSILAVSSITWIASRSWRVTKQRKKITSSPFPAQWRAILKHGMPYFRSLPADLQLQLKGLIQIFINEKEFIGCDGIIINDEIKVTIAAQACLLLLNRNTDFYPKLKQILVYPSIFIVKNQEQKVGGVIGEQHRVLSGESWETGKVVLSWQTTQADAAAPKNGNNVVIHEFAHQLDQEAGHANGAPILHSIGDYTRWSTVLTREFELLQTQAQHNTPSIFSYYGATNPAEFFAVITEVFFERPDEVYQSHRALYIELTHFFKLDPINWH